MKSGRKRPADNTSVPSDLLRMLIHSLEAELPRALDLRERLHMIPEPSHEEHATSGLVAEALGTGSVEAFARTGLLARVGPPGEAVAVRAELDALPIQEETDSSFAATNGLMHACGHDFHMAALAALFRAAERSEGSLPKPLTALFQPSEEAYPSGADLVVREGALTEGTGAIVAAHVHPEVPWGSVSVEAGPVNASSDNLHITVEGSGGHGAYPHRAHDPILALSHAVVALQSLVSRRLDPTHAAIVSVGWMRAGSAENVIPGVAEAGGTLRALDPADRQPLRKRGPRDRGEHGQGTRLRRQGGGDRGRASDGQRPGPGRSSALAAPRSWFRARTGDEILRIRRLRFLRSDVTDAHAVRRDQRRS